jgi:hypothetical protein
MESIKNNKVLATLLGIIIAGFVGLAALAYFAYSTYSESLLELEAMNSKLVKVEGAKIYPTAENVEKLDKQVTDYEDSVEKLTRVLLNLQQPAPAVIDTDFQAKLKQSIGDIKEQAAQAKVELPKEFNLGFDVYTRSLPKSPAAAEQLNDYFMGVDAVVRACIKSGVSSIDDLKRSELAIEKPDAPAPPPPTKAQLRTRKRSKGNAAPAKAIALTQVVERRQLTLNITSDQDGLISLLNMLADANTMPYFTVVRQLRIENEKQEGPSRGQVLSSQISSGAQFDPGNSSNDAPASGAPEEGAVAKPTEIIAPKASAPDAVAVMGQEKIKAQLVIDVVRFQEVADATETK